MSSSDTMRYADDEEEKARAFQSDIESSQAKISELQKDIERETQVIISHQEKQQQHARDAQNLRQKAQDEQRQEQQEELRKQQEDDDLAKKAAKEIARGGLF